MPSRFAGSANSAVKVPQSSVTGLFTIKPEPTLTEPNPRHSAPLPAGKIAGAVVGGLAAMIFLSFIVVVVWRRTRPTSKSAESKNYHIGIIEPFMETQPMSVADLVLAVSGKQRELAQLQDAQAPTTNLPAASPLQDDAPAVGEASQSPSAANSRLPASGRAVQGLRSEVADLRRAMLALNERLEPPGYQSVVE